MKAPNNLNALRAFEAAARHLSYVRAAEELNVTPAAIGQLARGLESYLGIELFYRSVSGPARLVLTDAAREALPDLQAGFDQLATAVTRLQEAVGLSVITVTVPPAFADKWLLPRIEHFQARYPNIDLRVDTNGQLVDFSAGRADVGLRYGGGTWPGLVSTLLLHEDFFPICSPALQHGEHPLRTATDLRYHTLIHDLSMHQDRKFPTWRNWLVSAGCADIDADRGLHINDSAAAMQAAIAGSGVAIGRSVLAADDLAAGRLVRPFGDEKLEFDYAYYIVHREEAGRLAKIEAFKDWLLNEAGRSQPELD